jgi:transposase-like protein
VSKAQQDIRRKTWELEHAARTGNVRQTCRYFGIPRSLFFVWRAAYEREGTAGTADEVPTDGSGYGPRLEQQPRIRDVLPDQEKNPEFRGLQGIAKFVSPPTSGVDVLVRHPRFDVLKNRS